MIKVDEGKGEGGSPNANKKKFLNVNIINFAKVDKGGGSAYPPKVDNLLCFFNPFLRMFSCRALNHIDGTIV